jgi:hypothetical protein
MKRRPFLHLAVGAAATAGCLGASESATGPHSNAQGPGQQTTQMAAVDDEDANNPALALEAVETFEYVVRLNDLGDDPDGAITEYSELTDRERAVVETAIADGYETDDPPEWLVKFASGTPVVERDGTYYRLENTFPTYTITAEGVAESDVDGAIASYEEYEEAVTRDGYVMSGLLRVARREAVELSYVWPALREFFERYDAVRYRGDLLSVAVEVEDPGPPYEITGTEVSTSDAVRGSVWNANEAPRAVRRLVRQAGRARGAYGFDRAPEGFVENLRSHEYVHLDGTFYTAYVEKEESVPLSVSAEFADGRLRLAIQNEGDRELRTTSGPPRPFGIVRCHPKGDSAKGHPETTHLLWTDAYEASDHVRTEGREVKRVEDVALVTTLAPGESASETFHVGTDVPPGEYVVADSLGVSGEQGENDENGRSTVRYRVVFSVNQ